MQSIWIELQEAGERLQEMTEAVLQGREVWITDQGEPVALATMEYATDEGPPAGARQVVLATLEAALNHLRKRGHPQPWCRN